MRMRTWARAAVGVLSAALLLTVTTAPAGAAGGDRTPPTTPTLRVSATTQSTASLSWTVSTDDGPYLSYRIFVDGVLWAFLTPIPSINSQTTTTLRHLTPDTAYAITVRAVDIAGNASAPSNTVTATTRASADTTPPTAPGQPRILQDLGCAVSLAWTASSDNVEAASAIEYEIVVTASSNGSSSVPPAPRPTTPTPTARTRSSCGRWTAPATSHR